MYASVRKFRCRPDQVADAMHRVDTVFAPRLEEMPGFVAYECIDCGDGTVCSMTICVDESTCERSVMMSAEFLRDDLPDIEIERVEALDGEVGVSRASNQVLEPAHA
jgi:hypothetical protein